jgi:hypothetical protein
MGDLIKEKADNGNLLYYFFELKNSPGYVISGQKKLLPLDSPAAMSNKWALFKLLTAGK